jgi:hypothetical protein
MRLRSRLASVIFLGCVAVPSVAHAQEETFPRPSPSPSPTPNPIPDWAIQLFNVDDSMTVTCNGTTLITVGYAQTNTVHLSSCLNRGQQHHIVITALNNSGGWTYGYRVTRDGEVQTTAQGTRAEDSCGQVGVHGCKNNDQTRGAVFQKKYRIDLAP